MREKALRNTHPVQDYIHVPTRINDGGVAAKLDDAPEYADDLVLEGLEVWGEDARGLGVVRHFGGGVLLELLFE